MTKNGEVITGSDFKRMVVGAYSEFLLEYENINTMNSKTGTFSSTCPGTDILRTMGAAVMPLDGVRDESIGGLAERVSSAVLVGARGNSGVVLAQMFRGLAKGLAGKYNATSSEFGKAFQYGILYAQRVIPEKPERPIITAAKRAAKAAYFTVMANMPIDDILKAALAAGKKNEQAADCLDVGERIMFVFLQGCLQGLDGNFVSPALSFSPGYKVQKQIALPDPRMDKVRPYCLTMRLAHSRAESGEVEKQLQAYGDFIVVWREGSSLHLHLHTDHPGHVLEQVIAWGEPQDICLLSMAKPHVLQKSKDFLLPVAVLAVSESEQEAERLQALGATVIISGGAKLSAPSVGELLNAVHSDMAAAYVLVSNSLSLQLVLQQVRYLLGNRVSVVLCADSSEQERVLRSFDSALSAADNAEVMQAVIA